MVTRKVFSDDAENAVSGFITALEGKELKEIKIWEVFIRREVLSAIVPLFVRVLFFLDFWQKRSRIYSQIWSQYQHRKFIWGWTTHLVFLWLNQVIFASLCFLESGSYLTVLTRVTVYDHWSIRVPLEDNYFWPAKSPLRSHTLFITFMLSNCIYVILIHILC